MRPWKSLFVENHDGRRTLIAFVYATVGVPYIAWLWIFGGLTPATLIGSLVPVSSVAFLLLVRKPYWWVWVYPLGVAPLLTCLAGAAVSGHPSLFMALLMGPAGIALLHDHRRSVVASWLASTVGFYLLAMEQSGGSWGYGATAVASTMYLVIALVVFSKAQQHRRALARATESTAEAQMALAVAVEVTKTRERFLANMTHELRTPLSGIIGMIELLPADAGPEVREVLETVQRSAVGLLEIVNDVLDFSKGGSGTLKLSEEPFSPTSVIRQAVRGLGPLAYERRIELLLDLAPNLPGTMLGDPLRFRQVLLNLVGNAVKFTEEGCVVVRAFLVNAPLSLCVEVVDTGIGIAPARLPSVFDAFTQVESSLSRRFKGTGLGLTISKQLVELMGGAIEVESELGRGSTFRFRLPLKVEEGWKPLAAVEQWLEKQRVALLPGPTGVRRLQKRLLDDAGARVIEVDRLKDLPGFVRRGGVDLCIVDLPRDGQWDDVVDTSLVVPLIALVTPLQRAQLGPVAPPHVALVEKPYLPQDLQAALLHLTRVTAGRLSPVPLPVPVTAAAKVLRVLVAEDNPVNARVARGFLGKLGHRCEVVQNGVEALAELARQSYDVVLMDLQMPEMDGLEATKRVRALELERGAGRLPIIIVSANSSPEDQAAGLAAGADVYIQKPLAIGRLKELLARVGEAGGPEAEAVGEPRRGLDPSEG